MAFLFPSRDSTTDQFRSVHQRIIEKMCIAPSFEIIRVVRGDAAEASEGRLRVAAAIRGGIKEARH